MDVALLTKLFNEIVDASKMPSEWRVGTVVSMNKHKIDMQNCFTASSRLPMQKGYMDKFINHIRDIQNHKWK